MPSWPLNPLAVEAGAEIFEQGGKAIDSAVGAAFVQGVIDPSMTSVGGLGTMLIYSAPAGKGEWLFIPEKNRVAS